MMRQQTNLFRNSTALCPLLMAALASTSPSFAQQAPDAGRTLQETLPPTLEAPRPAPDVTLTPPAETEVQPGGAKVTLSGIQLTGNSVFDEATLLAILGDFQGQSFDLAGLQALARRISEHYRAAGYLFAHAIIPAQHLEDGVLTLQIIEGRYGKVEATGVMAQSAQGYLSPLSQGSLIEASALERATLLLNDLPGIKATPIMRPGETMGTGDLLVEVSRDELFTGQIGFDNHGNRYTGQYRGRLDLQANSPFFLGDQFKGQFLYTNENLWLGSVNYSLPLGYSGLRGDVGYSHTYYELGKDFKNLKARGTAKVSSAGLSYPVIRSRDANLNLSAKFQHKDLEDRQDATASRNTKQSDVLPISLQFDRRDAYGITYGNLTYTAGRLKLDAALEAADIASGTDTRGHFGKWNLDLARLNTTPIDKLTLFGRLSSQWASKNLDSSESFILGGANGVRAYPQGEGNGDEGWFVQLEARYRLGNVEPFVFHDEGRVRINADPGRITPAVTNNTRSIAGSGLGVRFAQGAFSLEAAAAWRTKGGAPQSDTKDDKPRLWATAGYRF
jgi:hemolysin activation/secretion protein